MAFVNLPPNLQDIFYSITDRIAKLETGPNQAMYTAEAAQGSAQSATAIALSAQSVATQAQIDAISAGILANNAASQATIAQSQATIASSQATAAQVTANGKNKVYYSTSTPGSTANTVGDIWYQYGTSGTYANKVIAQWSGAGGTSWTSVTVSGLVIANIDAGTITTGILNAIEINAGSGGTAFHVSPGGYMSAQGVYVKGNITADSGTFTGTVRADTGYFGTGSGSTLTNGWSIGATGLTGVGTATITGGLIQGSSITVPNSSAWKFAVDSAGSLQAVNANVTGAITATSGTISGALTVTGSLTGGTVQTSTGSAAVILNGSSNAIQFKTSGSVVGNIVPLSSFGVLTHYGATADPSGGTFPQMFVGSTNVSMSASASVSLGVSTVSGITAVGSFDVSGSATFGSSTANPFYYLSSSGTLRSLYTYGKAVTGRAMQINSAGDFGTTASTLRKKHEVAPYSINTDALLQLKVKTFKYLPEIDEKQEQQYGFIAEEAEALDLLPLVLYNEEGQVDYFAYEKLPIFLLQLAQEQDARIKALEGK